MNWATQIAARKATPATSRRVAIAYVAAEALLGVMCPLTVWEDMLRGGVRTESSVGRWVRYFLYYEAPEWAFTVAYVAWALATVLTLRLVPARR